MLTRVDGDREAVGGGAEVPDGSLIVSTIWQLQVASQIVDICTAIPNGTPNNFLWLHTSEAPRHYIGGSAIHY
jgi:hypothetical protein